MNPLMAVVDTVVVVEMVRHNLGPPARLRPA